MALTVKDRVRVVTTTTGTSDFVLGGAIAGYQNFSVIGDGNTTYYACSDSATGDWEVGVGTYSSSGPTLSRDTVLESSNSGSKVSFAAGSKDVFVTYPAERAVYLDTAGSAVTTLDVGTLGVSTANITTANITAGTVTTTPASGNDLVNKTYVDTLVSSGIHFHQPVMVESPINLNATYNNGTAGVGATLTNAGTQVELIIDGIFTSPGDRVLVYNQTNPIENGIYVVTVVGTVSTNWVLTRASDADTYVINSANGLSEGSTVFVQLGATGAGETYTCNTSGVITFGTTAITFAQISSAQIYSAGTGLTLSGTQFSITNTGTAGTYGSASSVPVFTTNAQGQVTSVTNTAISITSAAVSGLAASATTDTTNAANITSGTLPSARINGSYTGLTGVGTLTAGTWNATTIGAAYGGTGQTSYVNGQLLIGNSTGNTLTKATLTAGTGISISNGAGSITISSTGGGVPCAAPCLAGKVFGRTDFACARTALGWRAGYFSQGSGAVAIGDNAAFSTQGSNAVAVGRCAGRTYQNGVAVGYSAGYSNQGSNAVAIGPCSGYVNQGASAIAIGKAAGAGSQPSNSIVIAACGTGFNATGTNQTHIGPIRNVACTTGLTSLFYNATSKEIVQAAAGGGAVCCATPSAAGIVFGRTCNSVLRTALGANAGLTSQGCSAVAIGACAGLNTQGSATVAIGRNAGATTQGGGAVAIGSSAGLTSQSGDAVAIGRNAGATTQGNSAVAIGVCAGLSNQGNNAIAIGSCAGRISQPASSIAIGVNVNATGVNQTHIGSIRFACCVSGYQSLFYCGTTKEIVQATGGGGGVCCATPTAAGIVFGRTCNSLNRTALGYQAGLNQSCEAVAIGYRAGQSVQGCNTVAVGSFAGQNTQSACAVAVGRSAGNSSQGYGAIAIGRSAGNNSQSGSAVAIGFNAGLSNQAGGAVAIGNSAAGGSPQGSQAVAIGSYAGYVSQADNAVAIGNVAGTLNQSTEAVAIGYNAGFDAQGFGAVAIGSGAGNANQGANSIAIGVNAGSACQHANSIILNATACGLQSAVASALYVKPIRAAAGPNFLKYNPATGEITYV